MSTWGYYKFWFNHLQCFSINQERDSESNELLVLGERHKTGSSIKRRVIFHITFTLGIFLFRKLSNLSITFKFLGSASLSYSIFSHLFMKTISTFLFIELFFYSSIDRCLSYSSELNFISQYISCLIWSKSSHSD